MERRDGGIELLGDLADRAGADPPAQHGQERGSHLAGTEPEHKAGQDHAIDMAGAPGISAHHRERAVALGARNLKLDVPQPSQEIAGYNPLRRSASPRAAISSRWRSTAAAMRPARTALRASPAAAR